MKSGAALVGSSDSAALAHAYVYVYAPVSNPHRDI
jgi:hypothetical protein